MVCRIHMCECRKVSEFSVSAPHPKRLLFASRATQTPSFSLHTTTLQKNSTSPTTTSTAPSSHFLLCRTTHPRAWRIAFCCYWASRQSPSPSAMAYTSAFLEISSICGTHTTMVKSLPSRHPSRPLSHYRSRWQARYHVPRTSHSRAPRHRQHLHTR